MRTLTPAAATPIAFVLAIVQAYRLRGMDATGALQKAQIAPELLNNPAARISVALSRWCRHHGLITDDIALTLSSASWAPCANFVWCRCCATFMDWPAG